MIEGSRRAMLTGVGICVGCLTWGLAASVGLGARLAVSRFGYDALRILGACYLIRPLSIWLRRPQVAQTLDRVTGVVLVGFGLDLVLDNRR